ncbi:MAG TPA: CBS domain-containing protein [Burkholderiales bacterium]|nr:CBS domain-containing protein [Burkholderiales bacterium]
MTNFERTSPRMVSRNVPIDRALERMRLLGVRSLFVLDHDGRTIGLVTSYDIQGEKPMQVLQSRDCHLHSCSRTDVVVADVMEPLEQLSTLEFEDVRRATIAEIAAAFRTEAKTHLVVTQHHANSESALIIRGLFSAADLERRLGVRLQMLPLARTFAEIERSIRGVGT